MGILESPEDGFGESLAQHHRLITGTLPASIFVSDIALRRTCWSLRTRLLPVGLGPVAAFVQLSISRKARAQGALNANTIFIGLPLQCSVVWEQGATPHMHITNTELRPEGF